MRGQGLAEIGDDEGLFRGREVGFGCLFGVLALFDRAGGSKVESTIVTFGKGNGYGSRMVEYLGGVECKYRAFNVSSCE